MSGHQKKAGEIMKHEGDSCWITRNTLEKLTEKINEAEKQKKSRNYRENDTIKISYNTEKSG